MGIRTLVQRGLVLAAATGMVLSLAPHAAAQDAAAACTPVTPDQSLVKVVAASAPGASFCLTAGVHRIARPVAPKDNQTFTGEPGAVISGAVVAGDFAPTGNRWTTTVPLPAQPLIHGECSTGSTCRFPNDVFIDGALIRRVASADAVVPGAYFQDPATGTIVLGTDPSGRNVEIALTSAAFNGPATSITIRNLVIERFANRAQLAAVDGRSASGWTIENVEARFNHGIGISIGSHGVVRNSYTHHNGQMGMSASGIGGLIEGTEIAYNNTAGFADLWEAGGTKFVKTDGLVVRNNHSHHNRGPGLWTDIDNINTLYEGNLVERNAGPGIFHEISYAATIRNNVSRYNGFGPSGWKPGAGIQVSNSSNVKVYRNKVVNNANGVMVFREERGAGAYGTWDVGAVVVRDNSISMAKGQSGFYVKQGGRSYFSKDKVKFVRNTYRLGRRSQYFEWKNWIRTSKQWRNYGQDARSTFRTLG